MPRTATIPPPSPSSTPVVTWASPRRCRRVPAHRQTRLRTTRQYPSMAPGGVQMDGRRDYEGRGTRDRGTPNRRIARRGVLKAGLAAGAVAGTGAWRAAPGRGRRLRQPGSLPYPDLPAGTDTIPQIEHVVVLMMENHSYDNRLGMLFRRGADGFRLGRGRL